MSNKLKTNHLSRLLPAGIWREDLTAVVKTPAVWFYALLLVVAPLISFFSLRALGSIVPGAAVILVALFLWQYRRFPLPSKALLAVWVAFMGLVMLAAMGAPDTDYAWGRASKLAMFSFCALMLWTCSRQAEGLHPLKTVMVGSVMIAVTYGLIEGLTDGWFFMLTRDVEPLFASVAANRPMVVLTLMIWPVVLILARRAGPAPVAIMLVVMMLASFSAESQSSQLGVVAGSLILALALIGPRVAAWVCLGGGVMAIIGMPFFFAFFDLEVFFRESALAKATILPRLELWTFVGEKVIAAFPSGYGLEAGRTLSLADMDRKYFGGSLMHHPHNGVLQIWLEFGLIGALAAATAWALLIKQCFEMDRWQAAAFLACASCFLLIASVSHGFWQSWWISALALVPFMFAIATAPEPQEHS